MNDCLSDPSETNVSNHTWYTSQSLWGPPSKKFRGADSIWLFCSAFNASLARVVALTSRHMWYTNKQIEDEKMSSHSWPHLG